MSTYDPESLPENVALELAELEAQRERDRLARDAGEGPEIGTRAWRAELREKLCARRLADGSWCTRRAEHPEGMCASIYRITIGPRIPPPERRLMTAFRAELSEKYDDKPRTTPWTDRFGERAPAGMSPAQRWCWRIER